MELQNSPNKQSRRNWLRDAAIATTGTALMPSLLTSCSDHRIPPGVGVGGPGDIPPAEFDLYGQASENLIRMRLWYDNLNSSLINPYILRVYTLLKGGIDPPTNWANIAVGIIEKIVVGLLQAAAEEIPGAGAVIGAAADQAVKWVTAEKASRGVDATIAVFLQGYGDMNAAVSNNLLLLSSDGGGTFANLRKVFEKGPIKFNGQEYTLKDLAQNRFPAGDEPADTGQYEALREAAFVRFKKYIWNAMLRECGQITYSSYWQWYSGFNGPITPTAYGRDLFYQDPSNKAHYLRGFWNEFTGHYVFRYWYFKIDGKDLSPDAGKELFIDDTPEHIINPAGLFSRAYVFKQFGQEKLDFFGYYELRKDIEIHMDGGDSRNFDSTAEDNYVFTGGDFPG